MWKPLVLQPITPRPDALKLIRPMFYTYALGWDVQDYRGAKVIWHGGAVFGFLTAVVLIPDKQIGFSIDINSEDGEIILGLMYELLDHYLGLPRTDWTAKLRTEKQRQVSEALNALKAETAKPAPIGPSLQLSRYAGTYADPWYGNIEVAEANGRLTIDFKSTPRMGGVLEHWQFDSFVTRFDDKSIEPAYVTFGLDAGGKVDRVTMKAVTTRRLQIRLPGSAVHARGDEEVSPLARWLLGAALLTTGANGTCAMGNVTAPPGSSGLIG
jgi:hypothetical protein